MSGPKRNVLLAALLAVFFALGAFLIIRPAFQSSPVEGGLSAGESSSSSSQSSGNQNSGNPPTGKSSSPISQSSGASQSSPASQSSSASQSSGNQNSSGPKPRIEAWRVGGATVDNQYPAANFGGVFTSGQSCAVLENLSSTLPITVVSMSVRPSNVYGARNCEPDLLGSTDLTGAVPCAPGVVLPPRQPPRRGCSVGVELLVTDRDQHHGEIVLVTRVTCTTRKVAPCTLLPSTLNPTEAFPITLTIDQKIGFTGSNQNNPDTETEEPPVTETEEPPVTDRPTSPQTTESGEPPVETTFPND
ncbi:hypothetical protein [Streptosporangium sp. CA-115845]|uniref:hypothetical protein n=1 Tax=Streptosporangium sp. CA-115845 TaxID=3240071 RepID=UPI003D916E52